MEHVKHQLHQKTASYIVSKFDALKMQFVELFSI